MRRHVEHIILAAVLAPALVLAACGDDGADSSDGSNGGDANGGDSTEEFNAEEYFSGKTIRFVTSSGSGGGTDRQMRALAQHLPRFIPGNPDAQASNQEPHVAGMNFLWNSEPDGLTIGMTAAPTLEFELFEDAQWNSAEYKYIGGIDSTCGSVLLAKGDTGYTSVDDVEGAEEPALIAQTSSPSPGDIEPHDLGLMLIADYLDMPLEIRRVAETGQDAMNLGMERGEINFGRYGSSWCILPDTNPGWLEDGYLVPLLDVEPGGPGLMPDAVGESGRPPHVADVLTEDQYATWEAMVAAPREGGNPIFLPPETPDEIVDVLRDAFAQAQEDPEFHQAMLDAFGEGEIEYINGADFQALEEDNRQQMLEFADEIEDTKEELYAKYVN